MKKIIKYAVIIFELMLVGSLLRGIQLSYRSKERISALEATKAKLQTEGEELNRRLAYVKSDFYLEKVAREELHLTKPGEKVVIIPDQVRPDVEEAQVASNKAEPKNWEKWWDVIRGAGN